MRHSTLNNGVTLTFGFGVRRSRSLQMAPFDRLYTTFYWSAIESIALSKSLKLVPFESLDTVSYWTFLVTVALSCIISEIKWDIYRKSRFFHTPLHLTPPLWMFLSESCHTVWYGKTEMV